MSRRVRLVVIPLALFAVVSAIVFALANDPPAKPAASAAAPSGSGDAGSGEQLFAARCASCHGQGGEGGGVGPELAGNPISLDDARARIETGSGIMPANLVEGQELEDVLAYLETILGR